LSATAIDPSNPNLSVTQFYEALVEQLGLYVEKSEWKTELVFDGQGKAVLNKDGTQKRKKYKLRRIDSDSWQLFEMFCEHRQAMKERRENPEETSGDSVPTCPENLYETTGGWNMGQPHPGQEDEGIDPLLKWKEGDRCWLWHPFAQNKWGMATVKKVVRGACGFVYALRDDGFGLHLGRDRLGLIVPTNMS
jgi:hypothetical protein